VSEHVALRLADEIRSLKRENAELLGELENAYAQLTAVMQLSQDETRIAYGELQEKIVVLEKKLFELDLLAAVGESLAAEIDLNRLRYAIVDKISVALPVDRAALHLRYELRQGTIRERDTVFDAFVDHDVLEQVRASVQLLETRGQRPLVVPDLRADAAFACLRLRPDCASAALVPIRGAALAGVLILNSRLIGNFRLDQEPLLGTFGAQAGWAVENALRLRWVETMLVGLLRRTGLGAEALSEMTATNSDGAESGLGAAVRALLSRS
jgi:GAF domain-containing protein